MRACLRQYQMTTPIIAATAASTGLGERWFDNVFRTATPVIIPANRWHLCTVAESRIDPHDVLGLVPNAPAPYFGWGNIPDQFGRAWAEEDAEATRRLDPELTDLPPLRPGWGPKS